MCGENGPVIPYRLAARLSWKLPTGSAALSLLSQALCFCTVGRSFRRHYSKPCNRQSPSRRPRRWMRVPQAMVASPKIGILDFWGRKGTTCLILANGNSSLFIRQHITLSRAAPRPRKCEGQSHGGSKSDPLIDDEPDFWAMKTFPPERLSRTDRAERQSRSGCGGRRGPDLVIVT